MADTEWLRQIKELKTKTAIEAEAILQKTSTLTEIHSHITGARMKIVWHVWASTGPHVRVMCRMWAAGRMFDALRMRSISSLSCGRLHKSLNETTTRQLVGA